MNILSYFSTLS